jgi:hypothetical protein
MGTKKNWHRRLRLTASIATALVCLDALAADPFGFPIGMSRKAAEEAAATMGLGISRWLGTSLIVQAQDDQRHSYLFNFCENKLIEASQKFPANFEQMANFVDAPLHDCGQPLFVSPQGAVMQTGFLRPISLYWKSTTAHTSALMQLPHSYNLGL